MSNKTIYESLISAGMTKEGACAMIGNMMAESGMKPNIAQRGMTTLTDEQYTEAADRGMIDFADDSVGYGLCQWTFPTRKEGLLGWAQTMRRSVGDEGVQVSYCIHELKSDYPALWNALCSSHDMLMLTQEVCNKYERPAHPNVGTRYEYAQQAYEYFCENGDGLEIPNNSPDACPVFPADPSVMCIQLVMAYNGYYGIPDGQKTSEFFSALRTFTNDMEKC